MSQRGGQPPGPGLLDSLDDSKVNRFQIKIMFVAGMGFFTDAYDLFVIGIVVYLLKDQWHLDTSQVSLLNSITLAASAVGALVFGRVADILGRKRIYGFEVLILAIGAIASAFAPNYTFLLISRAVLGIGIGGDYPVSATIMSEYSGKNTRGRMVGSRVREPGGWPHRRPAGRLDLPGLRGLQQPHLAAAARPGRHPGPGRVLPAPPDARNAAVRDGRRGDGGGRGGHRRGHRPERQRRTGSRRLRPPWNRRRGSRRARWAAS